MEGITTVFEDLFEISELNPDGKCFDSTSNRLRVTGGTFDCEFAAGLQLRHVQSSSPGHNISLVLASTLDLDGNPADHFSYSPSQNGGERPSLANNYEYVMHGRMYDVKILQGSKLGAAAGRGSSEKTGEDVCFWACTDGCGCDGVAHGKWAFAEKRIDKCSLEYNLL